MALNTGPNAFWHEHDLEELHMWEGMMINCESTGREIELNPEESSVSKTEKDWRSLENDFSTSGFEACRQTNEAETTQTATI